MGTLCVAGCKDEQNTSGRGTRGPRDSGDIAASGPPVDVRGAIYIPARAFNIYQMWKRYDPKIVERDLGYAKRVNLNAIRVWTSYGWWNADRKGLEQSFEHLLTAAEERGIRVLVGLFDAVGAEANSETLLDRNLSTATAVSEPGDYVMEDSDHWSGVRRYVNWFMDRYRNDDRLLAISVMNEPGWSATERRFARAMFREAAKRKGSVPLSIGATSLTNSARFVDWGADVVQFHYNFPRNREIIRQLLNDANELQDVLEKPVWLTEWQRVRRSGGGFGGDIQGTEWQPNYATMAPVIREASVGSFFWSLMVKPAWVPAQRKHDVVNGLFHEDGAVWSLKDARAIKSMSGESGYQGRERRQRPMWMRRNRNTENDNRSA